MKITKLAKIIGQWISPSGEGKQLEIIAADSDGKERTDTQFPLAAILADNKEVLFLEIYTDSERIQIPISELERAFELAKNGVHSEKWFDENVFNNLDKDQESP